MQKFFSLQNVTAVIAACILFLGFLWLTGVFDKNLGPMEDGVVTIGDQAVPLKDLELTQYPVKPGDFMVKIAAQYRIAPEDLIEINQVVLAGAYTGKCKDVSAVYKAGNGRRGHFCNESDSATRDFPAWANSLKPNEVLFVPVMGATNGLTAEVVRNVNTSIKSIGKGTVALVVDKSGSMDDDRIQVAKLYEQLLDNSQIIGTVVFSEHAKVVKTSEKLSDFFALGDGGLENTLSALTLATTLGADQIVLITDEPGNDWSNGKPDFHKSVTVQCLDMLECGNLVEALK